MKLWQVIILFGFGFWLGFLAAALMAMAGRAERVIENLRHS